MLRPLKPGVRIQLLIADLQLLPPNPLCLDDFRVRKALRPRDGMRYAGAPPGRLE